MKLRAGTSGFAYDEWKGSFYPHDLPASKMLAFYASHFSTVEINNTFYRMPARSVLEQWAAQVPDDFAFVLKASQRITHFRRLRDAQEPLDYLLANASVIANALGPILFQLPPNLKKDTARLDEFLGQLDRRARAAFEFRHESWFDDDVFETLRRHEAALCIADAEDLATPFVPTAPWGYLRLRREGYDDAALEDWAARIAPTGWGEAFVFFKHEDAGTGPALAHRFEEIASRTLPA